jgi:gliding motility-associated-like protein
MIQLLKRACSQVVIITLVLSISQSLIAQIEVEPTGALFTPESLITNVFLGEGVEVTNLTFDGSTQAAGYFTNGLNDIGIDRGIVISSGFAVTAATQNNAGGTTGATTGPGTDTDLGPISSGSLNDIVRYSISFIPTSDTLRFKYVFASEEYPEYACSGFNDVFGFFITGPDPAGGMYNGDNIALVPDPSDPSGFTFTDIPVTINNVNNQGINPPSGCAYDYGTYYNDNNGSMTLTYDAYLDVFIAQAIVIPCEEYTIKLAVADVGDNAFDTSVFLEAKSFGTGSLDVEFASLSLDGTVTEDCASATLTFELPSEVESDFPIDYTIIGTATNGIDYQTIPPDLFIAAGDTAVSVDVIAWEDGIAEGIESIGIDVQRDPCNRDTFWLFIRDNEILPPDLGIDQTICQGDSAQLDGTLPITLPDPPVFTNETDQSIVTISNNNPPPPGTLPTQSTIQVFGVQPTTLQAGVIKSVCLDVDHNWASDVDIFLVGPNGQFIELSTDNGGSGNDYTTTCFTPDATAEINFGSQAPASAPPFTGEWLPEGSWEDLWTITDPLTNGDWTLQIKDDQTGFDGTLLGWSICFNPLYQINYSWTPTNGLSCSDCPNPMASPDSTTTYYLEASDTYGCAVYDTITVNVIEQLPPPDAVCSTITDSSIEFCWNPLTGSSGYEVNVEGTGWISPSGALCHTVTGLTLEDTVTLEVRGLGMCNGMIDTVTCWTPACTPPSANIIAQSDADCFGANTGSITVTGMGTNPPFTYQIVGIDTNSTGIFNNLPAGNYSVLVLDAVNCPQSVPFTIDQPDEIVASEVLITNASCNGGADGSATFNVSGGTAPYSFLWSNSQPDSIALNLALGDYYVTITDANNCSIIDTVTVTQPPVMSLSFNTNNVSCNSAGDGEATVNVIGGVGPYTYQWDINASNQITSTADNLSGGTYFITVTDQNNCAVIADTTIAENPPITLSFNTTNISCFGGSDGQAQVVASGGTGTYTYQWNDPNNQIGDIASSLSEGVFSVTVTDSDNCTAIADTILNQPVMLDANVQVNAASCFGSTDGTTSIIVSGGTFPYSYSWSDNVMVIDSARTDLSAGNYFITVSDANVCVAVLNFTVDQPDSISLDFVHDDVSCNGLTDGSATVSVSGGTNGYSYLWDASAGNQITATATNLLAGTFDVTVTDFNNCTNTASITIDEPDVLALANTATDVLCFGNATGEIDLTVAGGTTPYNITWGGPSNYSAITEDVTDLFAGNYNVIVSDANNCTDSLSIDVMQPATGIMSTMSPTDSICFESNSGSASVAVGGGTGPFTYQWSNGAVTDVISSLNGGIYTVTITDSGNCTFVDTARVIEAPQIEVNLSQTGTLCHDGSDGTATVESIIVNGIAQNIADYDLLWNVSGQTSSTINNLTGGENYSLTVTDADGCTGSTTIQIGNPEEIGSRVDAVRDASCFQSNDGEITVSGQGGIAPYTYQWDANASGQTTEVALNLTAGDYTVTITDANNCFTTLVTTVSEPTALEVNFTTEGTGCFGDPSGSAAAFVSGGSPVYNYNWSTGDDSNGIEAVAGGLYYLTITDEQSCILVDSVVVSQPEELDAQIDAVNVSCYDGRDGEIMFLPSGGTPPYTYSLDGLNFNGSSLQIGLTPGTYPTYIRDVNGCEIFLGDFGIGEPDPIIVDLGPDSLIRYGQIINLNPSITGGQGTFSFQYAIEDSASLSCISCQNPNVSPVTTTIYDVLVTDENGCTGEASVVINVFKDRPLNVPTGFTPNGDGTNDILRLYGQQVAKIITFEIYDRWGEKVYEAGDYDYDHLDETAGWDGNFRGKPMNPGTFIWFIKVEFIDGTTEAFRGNSTLIR